MHTEIIIHHLESEAQMLETAIGVAASVVGTCEDYSDDIS